MLKDSLKNNRLDLQFDTQSLTQVQIRIIRNLSHTLAQLFGATDEAHFFEKSSELMKMCATAIKHANFSNDSKNTFIPYADQAIEFSIDHLTDYMSSNESKLVAFDN